MNPVFYILSRAQPSLELPGAPGSAGLELFCHMYGVRSGIRVALDVTYDTYVHSS